MSTEVRPSSGIRARAIAVTGRSSQIVEVHHSDVGLGKQLIEIAPPQNEYTDQADSNVPPDQHSPTYPLLPADIRPLQQGLLIADRYRLIRRLGMGGMGDVWLAEQLQPIQREVALKVIMPVTNTEHYQIVLTRFERERQALALMEHPNIAKVLDAGSMPDGRPFLAMELVSGVSITKYCDVQRLGIPQRIELFIHVCEAVQHAHHRGVVHRDLKPSNILVALVDGLPVVKVIDFGIAKSLQFKLSSRSLDTAADVFVGTFEYMAPEQFDGEPSRVDPHSDIYALGIILYELLAGCLPISREKLCSVSIDELLRLIRVQVPPKPSEQLKSSPGIQRIADCRRTEPKKLCNLISGDLDWITMRCLEKEKTHRYATASELGQDLLRYLKREPVLAGPPSAYYQMRKFYHRHQLLVIGSILLLLTLVAGIVGTTIGMLKAQASQSAAILERDAKELARQEAERARKQATAEAASALATNDFLLKDLLGQADIGNQLGEKARDPDVKVRTLLDRAARGLAGKFKDQPATKASIRMTIGESYLALGDLAQAQPFMERAIDILENLTGSNDPVTLQAKSRLAHLLVTRGKFDQAEKLFLKVMEPLAEQLTGTSPVVLNVKAQLANLYRAQGKFTQATLLYEELLKTRSYLHGNEHHDTLVMRGSLGSLYKQRGDYALAEGMLKQAVQGLQLLHGNDHPDTLAARNNLAECYAKWDKMQLAQNMYQEVVPTCVKLLGKEHRFTLMTQFNLASMYRVLGKFEQARLLHEEVLATRKLTLGNDHPDVLASKNNLAMAYESLGMLSKSESLYSELLQQQRRVLGFQHHETLVCMNNLGALYMAMKKHDQATKQFTELFLVRAFFGEMDYLALSASINNLAVLHTVKNNYSQAVDLLQYLETKLVSRFGADHPETLKTRFNLAAAYRMVRKPDLAIKLAEQTLAGQTTTLGASHPKTQRTKNLLIVLFQEANRYDQTADILAGSLKDDRAKLGDDVGKLAQLLATQAVFRLHAKQFREAEPLLRECLAIRQKLEPDDWTTWSTMSMLGGSLMGQQKQAEAEKYLRDGYEGMKQREGTIPLQGKLRYCEGLDRLIAHCQATNKPDEVKTLQVERARFKVQGEK